MSFAFLPYLFRGTVGGVTDAICGATTAGLGFGDPEFEVRLCCSIVVLFESDPLAPDDVKVSGVAELTVSDNWFPFASEFPSCDADTGGILTAVFIACNWVLWLGEKPFCMVVVLRLFRMNLLQTLLEHFLFLVTTLET